jgi:hypothetical protein
MESNNNNNRNKQTTQGNNIKGIKFIFSFDDRPPTSLTEITN